MVAPHHIDLVALDEQLVSLADNALYLNQDEAYRLCITLQVQFQQR